MKKKTTAKLDLIILSRWVYRAPQHLVRRASLGAMVPDLPILALRLITAVVFLVVALVSYYLQDNYIDGDPVLTALAASPLLVAVGFGGFAAAFWTIILWAFVTTLIILFCGLAFFMHAAEHVISLFGLRRPLIDQAPLALLVSGTMAMVFWVMFLVLY
jgi:hypothetical protein